MGIGCARGQRSTQFCADITGVRAELDAATDMAIHYRDSAMAGDADLARVKAESLRVVVDGARPLTDETVNDWLVERDGVIYRLERWEDE